MQRNPGFTISTAVAWLIYAFLVLPTLIVIPMSFGKGSELVFPPRKWSLSLYRAMLDPAEGWIAAGWNSLQIAFGATVLAVILGVPASYALARRKPFIGMTRFLALSPIFIPTIVLALGLYLYFMWLGINGTKIGLMLAHAVLVGPFVLLTVGAALNQLDKNVEVASSVLGAGTFRIFLQVVLPGLRPAIVSSAFFAFLLSFDEVVVAWFIGKGANPTLPVKMYSSIQWEISPVLAAISSILVVLTTAICVGVAFIQPNASEPK